MTVNQNSQFRIAGPSLDEMPLQRPDCAGSIFKSVAHRN
jgi:hypothetical protein